VATARAITDPDIAKALAHPLRMRLLSLLEDGTASPTELADVTGASLPRVSYHVRRLASAGLIELVRTKQRRGAVEHYYAAVQQPAVDQAAWAPLPSIAKTAMASATLAHMRDEINAAVEHGGFDRPDIHLSRTPITLDEEGWEQVSRRVMTLHEDIRNIALASAARLEQAGREGAVEAMSILMLFERRTKAPGRSRAAARKPRSSKPAATR
jgi:DNA-binding transcriptional ArsR family regulator